MKALSLKIQAFGPFANTQTIDFSAFGTSSLYLINGNTGSGKTTILDGISFALYGDTTGKERDAAEMRCDYADPDLLTEVLFDFQLGEKTYRVQRLPKQTVNKKRGEGTTEKAAEANLWAVESDGNTTLLVPRKTGEVTQKIVELMGLNGEQFRQVMVLPQGRFRELLLASSSDREVIFSQLFQTQIYREVEESIKAQAKGVRDKIADYHIKMAGILDTVELNSDAEVDAEIETLIPQQKMLDQQKQKATDAHLQAVKTHQTALSVQEQFANLHTQQAKWAQHLQQQPQIDQLKVAMQRAQSADKIRPLFEAMVTLQQEKQNIQQTIQALTTGNQAAINTLNAALEKEQVATKNAEAIDCLNRQQDSLQSYQGVIEKLELAHQVRQAAEQKAQAAQTLLAKAQADRARVEAAQTTAEQRQQTLQAVVQPETTVRLNEEKLRQHLALLKESEQLSTQMQHKQREGEQANGALELATQALNDAQNSASTLEMHWHLGQAAVLAQTLQTDQACPVCGSADHPHPAQWQDPSLAVDKAQRDAAQAKVTQAHAHHSKAESLLASLRTEYSVLKTQSTQLHSQLNARPEFAELSMQALQTQLAEHQQQMTQITQAQNELLQIHAERQALDAQRAAFDSELSKAQTQANTQNTEAQLSAQAWSNIQSQLPEQYRDLTALHQEIQAVQQQIATLKQAQQNAVAALQQAKSQADRAQQSLDSRLQQLQELVDKVTASEQQWLKTLEMSDFSDQTAFATAQWTPEMFELHTTTVQRFEETLNQLNGAIQHLNQSLEGKVAPDLPITQAVVQQAKTELDRAESDFHAVDSALKNLRSVQQKLAKAQQENQKLLEEYKLIGTLSEVLSGKEGDKVNLQRFVLSLLLDDVLTVASQHLKIMSKDRYALVRKDERSKGGKASGLELEIYDTWNDNSRGVATLSGGESFMAALSLALGLSDVVQSYSGGIKLDTLFIDEGFGSLDQDSLDRAIETLKQLQASGRSIGIISHVSELKEQMANRIDVQASNVGSTIKVVSQGG